MTVVLFSQTESVYFPLNIHNPCADGDYNWIEIPEEALTPIEYELRSEELQLTDTELLASFRVGNEFCGDL